MTLREIEQLDTEVLLPAQVAEVLGCFQYSITTQARENAAALGFPVIITGTRVRIPKEAFVRFMKGELPVTSSGCAECIGKPMFEQIHAGARYCRCCGRRFHYERDSSEGA